MHVAHQDEEEEEEDRAEAMVDTEGAMVDTEEAVILHSSQSRLISKIKLISFHIS